MRWLRKLLGTDFPDPAPGQVWRSGHSGRAFRVHAVERSDCGQLWHIDLQHDYERGGAFIPLPMSCCMFPSQWRRMLRDEKRELVGADTLPPPPLCSRESQPRDSAER